MSPSVDLRPCQVRIEVPSAPRVDHGKRSTPWCDHGLTVLRDRKAHRKIDPEVHGFPAFFVPALPDVLLPAHHRQPEYEVDITARGTVYGIKQD